MAQILSDKLPKWRSAMPRHAPLIAYTAIAALLCPSFASSACTSASLAGTWVAYISNWRCQFTAGKKFIKPDAVCDDTARSRGTNQPDPIYRTASIVDVKLEHDCSISGKILIAIDQDIATLEWIGQLSKSKNIISGLLFESGGAMTMVKK